MNRRAILALSMTGLLCSEMALPGAAVAQTAKDLVGAWTFVSNVSIRPDGSKYDGFSKGTTIFDGSGRFVILNVNSGLPKFASNNRMTGTPDENKAIVQGIIGLFGTYSVTDKVLVLKVEASTFPAFDGTEQKRTIAAFSSDELTLNFPGSAGERNEQVLKRAK